MSDPTLDALLSAEGCPFKGGTVESVHWMLGYKAGLSRAKAEFAAAAAELDPHKPTIRTIADVRANLASPKPRRDCH